MFSQKIEIAITLLQNVSNSEVSGGDVDGSFGGCGSWGCVVRCRGGHGIRGDDVGDGVVVVVDVVMVVVMVLKVLVVLGVLVLMLVLVMVLLVMDLG